MGIFGKIFGFLGGIFSFFGNLLGSVFSKNKEEDVQPKDAFYLEDETAKSMGDTAYMKAPKSIRRTFPKGAAGTGHFEVISTVSSDKASKTDSRKNEVPKRVESIPTYSEQQPSFSSASSFGNASSFGSASSFGNASSFGKASSFGSSYSAPEPAPTPAAAPEPKATASASNEASTTRRKPDNSMDMFRNMAKDVRK